MQNDLTEGVAVSPPVFRLITAYIYLLDPFFVQLRACKVIYCQVP
jgi:hypothetical protein